MPVVGILNGVDGEDQGTPERDPDDDWSSDADLDGDGLRGWISPDDRLWRHPSESAGMAGGTDRSDARGLDAHRPRSAPWVIGGATMCFVLVLVAAGVMISTTGNADHSTTDSLQKLVARSVSPTTEPGTAYLPSAATVKGLVEAISPSTVAIISTAASGTTTSAGLVVAAGGMIVTTASAVAGARSITVVEAGGKRWPGTVIGGDKTTGLTLISVEDELPAAVFDSADPAPGSVAMAMSLERARSAGGAPTMKVYAGQVVSSGHTVTADRETASFTSTALQAPLPKDDIGCPMVDAQGHVTGLLEAVTGSNGSELSVFLPAQLVFGVAMEIIRSNEVRHGSLGVQATDAQPIVVTATTSVGKPVGESVGSGARLVAVKSDGPASYVGLAVGDVITAVDGAPVHSLAELETRLYADAPGDSVTITYVRDGKTYQPQVTLDAGDPDASAVSSSP